MLEDILSHLKNWFLIPGGIHEGSYTIENGEISLPFLREGQYFRICESLFNDGLHQYPAKDLTDEAFEGVVWALAVPKAVSNLAVEVETWIAKNGSESPYTSESFGGYSYSRTTNSNGQASGWQDVFRPRLNRWRRISEL